MEIILQIKIYTKDDQIVLHYTKSYESSSIPTIGMKIKDDLFAELKEVIEVTIDYSRNKCYVKLPSREETKDRIESGHIQEVADMHGWTRVEVE